MERYTYSHKFFAKAGVLTLALTALAWAGTVSAATISSTLDFGATGSDVTSLQQFLAGDVHIYPEGVISGYFGPLTRAAVQRYQCQQGIVCSGDAASTGYGRVGPRTLTAINASIGGVATGDVSAPILSTVVVSTTTSSATITWATNELARGTVYYSSSPLPLLETSVTSGAFVGGQTLVESALGFSHGLSITGLQPNTWYYYAVASTDAGGNLQLTWPATFRTGP